MRNRNSRFWILKRNFYGGVDEPGRPAGESAAERAEEAVYAAADTAGVTLQDIVDFVADPPAGGLSADYAQAIGKYTATGYNARPTLYDPAQAAWDDTGWVQFVYNALYVDLNMGMGDGTAGGIVNVEAAPIQAVLDLAWDGWDGTGGEVRIKVSGDLAESVTTMAPGQTASPFVIKDSTGATVAEITETGILQGPNSLLALGASPELWLQKDGETAYVDIATQAEPYIALQMAAAQTAAPLVVKDSEGATKFEVNASGALAKLNATTVPITGVAVTAGGVHAALVTLGLIAA